MDSGTVQFIIFLLIIIVIKESLVEAVILEATPTGLAKSGNTVTWTWKDLTTPLDLDCLGIYAPLESSDDYFIDYALLSSCKDSKSRTGSYQFMALNMQASCGFRLYESYPRDAEAVPLDEDQNPLLQLVLQLGFITKIGCPKLISNQINVTHLQILLLTGGIQLHSYCTS